MNQPQLLLSQRSLEVLRFVHTVVHPVENLSLHCNFCSSCLRKACISSSSSRNSFSAQSTFSADGAYLTEYSMKHNTISHTLHACTPSPVPHAPMFVVMRGVTRHCDKTTHVKKKPVHRARCQHRWMGPPAHGAVANHFSPRNRDSHREVERSGEMHDPP